MSYEFSKYILAFSCTWISKLRGPKEFSLQDVATTKGHLNHGQLVDFG